MKRRLGGRCTALATTSRFECRGAAPVHVDGDELPAFLGMLLEEFDEGIDEELARATS